MIVSSPMMGLPISEMSESDIINEISALEDRIEQLGKRVDELYRRPQMDYTDYANTGDLLYFNIGAPNRTAPNKPRWGPPNIPPEPTTSDTYQIYAYVPTTGTRIDNIEQNILLKVKQPYKTITTGGTTINSFTTTPTITPTLSTFITGDPENVQGTVTITNQYHWESVGGGEFSWVLTRIGSTFTWNGSTPGTYTVVVTTGTTYETLPTIINTTTPTTTPTTSP